MIVAMPSAAGQLPWLWGPLAGLAGGLLGALLLQVLWNTDDFSGLPRELYDALDDSEWFARLSDGIYFGLTFLAIGFVVYLWPRLTRGEAGRAFGDAGIGAAVGAGAGFLGGLMIVVVYFDILKEFGDLQIRIGFLVGFGIIGVVLGLFFAMRCAPGQVGVAVGLVTGAAVVAGQIWETALHEGWLAGVDFDYESTVQRFVFGSVAGVLIGLGTAAVEAIHIRSGGLAVRPAFTAVAPASFPGATPPTGGYPAQPGYRIRSGTSGFAVAALVFGIVGGWLLALIFGYVALSQIRRSQGFQGGRGMAVAGVVLGWIWLGLLVVVVAAASS